MQKHSKTGPGTSAKHLDPKSLTFTMFTSADIRRLSVKKISTPLSFNVLGHPLRGGLYDPALGPVSEQGDPCSTCGGNTFTCPGHIGHIELPMSVVNPLFHKQLATLIKLTCLSCFKLQIPDPIKLLLVAKLKLLDEGYVSEITELEQEVGFILASTKDQVGVTEYVKEAIDAYVTTLRNRHRFDTNLSSTIDESNSNTKNANVQRFACVENALKQFQTKSLCIHCQRSIHKVTAFKNKLMTTRSAAGAPNESNTGRRVIRKLDTVLIMPDQSREYLRQLWLNERDILEVMIPCLSTMKTKHPTDVLFFQTIPVLPPIVRPVNYVAGSMLEHPQTQAYKTIIEDSLVLRYIIQTIQDGGTSKLPEEGRMVFEKIRGKSSVEKLQLAWQQLQANVDHLMDRDISRTSQSASCQGLKQVIEKKEGVIRMHMMGKRVNFAARSVITPDPNLNIDEIGIPEAFALKLTYPVPVTPWNVAELRQMIINGPNVHPGAVMVENENGTIKRIHPTETVQREALAKRLLTTNVKANKLFNRAQIVHRHLQNGDVLLLNRQPTLHRPSIMAHKARILKGEKTLRLHYANCKAYNADFDGDEMNAHFPQNELARSEGYHIANVSNQYLVPKDGTPLSGLIQDHMISGVRLTLRGQFFTREDYMQFVYSALADVHGELITLPPAIIKPELLWSGKQVLSTVIINITPRGKAKINLTAGAKIGPKAWEVTKPRKWKCGTEFKDSKTMSEAQVVIRNGELLCGVLDKIHYGATPYGLIHCVYELYGGTCSSKLLSAFGKLFQTFLQRTGFTLGVEDILLLSDADDKRTALIESCRKIGESTQRSILELPEDTPSDVLREKMQEAYLKNPKFRAQVDRKYKTALDVYTNDINKVCLPAGLKKFPDNNLQLMVQSGAKGSTVNTMQISCLLGQIELEGKRPPLMISGKSLPSFAPYDPTPRAGGFIDGRFMTGIQPQEFFFHCMAGREGLIDTAVKTSRSGYLQRCLIKHLEGLTVGYDSTVRDSDGSLIQLNYGEDGLDVPGAQFLRKEQMNFLADNKNAIVEGKLLDTLKAEASAKEILKSGKKIQKWIKKNGDPLMKRRVSDFAKYSKENSLDHVPKYQKINQDCGRSRGALNLMKRWVKLDDETKQWYDTRELHCPDPVFSKYKQSSNYGVLTERIEKLMDNYLSTKETEFITKDELRDVMSFKVTKTLCQPGEPVGLLAAQSIGEPSTQMTLNTFHFAGRGEMNVTLGIPRLREILMMASKNIKTPSMEIPFRSNLKNMNKQADKLRLKLTRCVLSNILTDINLDGRLELWPTRRMEYTLKVNLLRRKSYKREYCVSPKYVVERIEQSFFNLLFKEIRRAAKTSGALLHVQEETESTKDKDTELDADDPESTAPTNRRASRLLGEEHESSDEDEAAEDADATAARSMSRHQENQEYDDPDEDKEESDDSGDEETTNEAQGMDNGEKDDVMTETFNNLNTERRKKLVLDMYPNAIEYDFDDKKYSSCTLKFWLPLTTAKLDLSTIIRSAAEKVVLWETPLIKRAFTFQNQSNETVLKTDGINIIEMFKYNEILDLNRLYSNDIYGICQTHGIEAANRVIVKEVKDVFKMYGITVDPRHLLLIADYMTFDGSFQPLSRKGMENAASPLQQISFESSLTFLKTATLQSKQDDLVSPSSRLMLGQPCKSGTGSFTLMHRMENDILAL